MTPQIETDASQLTYLFDVFLSMVSESHKEKGENVFLQREFGSWHHYYEMSKAQLISEFIEISSLKSEALEYIFSENPIDTIIEISKQSEPKNPPKEEELTTVLSVLYAISKNYECILYHKKTIQQLLHKIKNNQDTNDNLLQKLLTIDKTIINSPLIRERLQKAQLNNDEKFFRKVANSLAPRKPLAQNKDAEFIMMIFFLMDHGDLQSMSEKKKIQALKKYKSPYISDESFARKIYKFMNLYY